MLHLKPDCQNLSEADYSERRDGMPPAMFDLRQNRSPGGTLIEEREEIALFKGAGPFYKCARLHWAQAWSAWTGGRIDPQAIGQLLPDTRNAPPRVAALRRSSRETSKQPAPGDAGYPHQS